MAPVVVLFVVLLLMPAVLSQVAAVGHRRVRTRQWLALPEAEDDQPRRGYKTAQVLIAPDRSAARLKGITVGGSYEADDEASCVRGCTPPALGCTCGFYALKRRDEALDLLRETLAANGLRHKALLTVDLDGEVLEYERGYRGEHQRVMGVEFERVCARCADLGRPRLATTLAAARSFRLSPFARTLGAPPSPATRMLPVRPVCDDHVPDGAVVLTLGDLAGLLSTEVSWLR